jgi:dolichol-phosphate mannosyltransferase
MDGDLSHAPHHLPAMLAALSGGADVVVGSRYVRDGGTVNWGIRRVLLSWLANRFSAFLLRIPAHDVTSGFRLYRAGVLRRIGLDQVRSTGYSFLVELLYRAHRLGARIEERPIVFHDRRRGKSKLRSREIYLGALRLLGLRLMPPSLP